MSRAAKSDPVGPGCTGFSRPGEFSLSCRRARKICRCRGPVRQPLPRSPPDHPCATNWGKPCAYGTICRSWSVRLTKDRIQHEEGQAHEDHGSLSRLRRPSRRTMRTMRMPGTAVATACSVAHRALGLLRVESCFFCPGQAWRREQYPPSPEQTANNSDNSPASNRGQPMRSLHKSSQWIESDCTFR